MKIVHFMAKQQWIITARGRGGGIRLNPETLHLRLGEIVRVLQADQNIVECNTPPCVLRSNCGLKGILDQALDQFYHSLDQYTLADVLGTEAQNKFTTHSPINLINLVD
jgi:Rrf2 family nitric oxide-sensitive transcriptional repressor